MPVSPSLILLFLWSVLARCLDQAHFPYQHILVISALRIAHITCNLSRPGHKDTQCSHPRSMFVCHTLYKQWTAARTPARRGMARASFFALHWRTVIFDKGVNTLMAGSSYGTIFRITTWGESHGKGPGRGCGRLSGRASPEGLRYSGIPEPAPAGAEPLQHPAGRK